jgi:hypothetical protein
VKIVGGIGAGLLTLLLLVIAFLGGKGMTTVYFSNAQPPGDLTVAGTPEQIARGQYLVELSCAHCHSATDADGNQTGMHSLSGGWNFSQDAGFGFVGDMVAENLTPGGKLADYSDGELFRALRYSMMRSGQRPDGTVLKMPFSIAIKLTGDDLTALYTYLTAPVP